jgi:hypothetical protein
MREQLLWRNAAAAADANRDEGRMEETQTGRKEKVNICMSRVGIWQREKPVTTEQYSL